VRPGIDGHVLRLARRAGFSDNSGGAGGLDGGGNGGPGYQGTMRDCQNGTTNGRGGGTRKIRVVSATDVIGPNVSPTLVPVKVASMHWHAIRAALHIAAISASAACSYPPLPDPGVGRDASADSPSPAAALAERSTRSTSAPPPHRGRARPTLRCVWLGALLAVSGTVRDPFSRCSRGGTSMRTRRTPRRSEGAGDCGAAGRWSSPSSALRHDTARCV